MTERAAVLDLMKYRVPTSTIVIIDDQSTGRMVLTEIIRVVNPRIKVVASGNPAEAIEYVRRFPVSMVVTDFMMPRMDGVQTTRELRRYFSADELPIVMTTIVHSRDLLYRAFEAGASEYLLRPVDPIECRLRFEYLLARRQSHMAQKEQIKCLKRLEEQQPRQAHSDDDLMRRIAAYHTHYDLGSGRSQQNVPIYATLLARVLGCNEAELDLLNTASSVHDIGEMALPADLWGSELEFSSEQQIRVQQHTHIGHDLLADSHSPVMQCAAEIALNHHERADGSGYPRGLCGKEVSSFARIVSVADVFNALVSERPHRPAMRCSDAVSHLCNELKQQFDPEVLQALKASVDALEGAEPRARSWSNNGAHRA